MPDGGLQRAHVLHVVDVLGELLVLAVEPVHPVHLLLDLVVALADLHLVLLDERVLGLELVQQLAQRVAQLHVVRLRVQGVHLDARHLVLVVPALDLLLVDHCQHLPGLLLQVLHGLGHGGLRALVGLDALLQLLPLAGDRLQVLLQRVHLLPQLPGHQLHLALLLVRLRHRPLEHRVALGELLALGGQLGALLLRELGLVLQPLAQALQALVGRDRPCALALGALRLQLVVARRRLSLTQRLPRGRERLVAPRQPQQRGLPLLQQLLLLEGDQLHLGRRLAQHLVRLGGLCALRRQLLLVERDLVLGRLELLGQRVDVQVLPLLGLLHVRHRLLGLVGRAPRDRDLALHLLVVLLHLMDCLIDAI
mmetsp:Transcript_15403/g.24326  ORF Transcript_15403/g.24326 Transcript_15403/m.24326 type:complete len:366 (-) Transcript_15403:519-1616(-)